MSRIKPGAGDQGKGKISSKQKAEGSKLKEIKTKDKGERNQGPGAGRSDGKKVRKKLTF